MTKILNLILFLFLFTSCNAQNYIVKQEGNIPVIISVPHGGVFKPIKYPTRNGIGFNNVSDSWTIEIAKRVEQELNKLWGKPYLIYSTLHRSKLDLNREIEEATDTNKVLYPFFNEYHDFIKSSAIKENKKVLLIDIHGHRHKNPELIELGYGIDKETLIGKQSIKNNLFWSDRSFGSILNKLYGTQVAYPPNKLDAKEYFMGGYTITQKYDNAFCIQIEIPYSIRKFHREKIAKLIAKSINDFYKLNFE